MLNDVNIFGKNINEIIGPTKQVVDNFTNNTISKIKQTASSLSHVGISANAYKIGAGAMVVGGSLYALKRFTDSDSFIGGVGNVIGSGIGISAFAAGSAMIAGAGFDYMKGAGTSLKMARNSAAFLKKSMRRGMPISNIEKAAIKTNKLTRKSMTSSINFVEKFATQTFGNNINHLGKAALGVGILYAGSKIADMFSDN